MTDILNNLRKQNDEPPQTRGALREFEGQMGFASATEWRTVRPYFCFSPQHLAGLIGFLSDYSSDRMKMKGEANRWLQVDIQPLIGGEFVELQLFSPFDTRMLAGVYRRADLLRAAENCCHHLAHA